MQILRYKLGQEYVPYYDYFDDEVTLQLGGHRIATVLMYLSNVKKGGDKVFPKSEVKYRQSKGDDWSDCAKQGYAVKPRKGHVLLFFNLHLNATMDPSSLHGSCPVIDGKKWSATKWLHVRDFDESRTISGCFDLDLNCATWAEQGECEINPLYQVAETIKGGDRTGLAARSSGGSGLSLPIVAEKGFWWWLLAGGEARWRGCVPISAGSEFLSAIYQN